MQGSFPIEPQNSSESVGNRPNGSWEEPETRTIVFPVSHSYHQKPGNTDQGNSRLRVTSQAGGWKHKNENEKLNFMHHAFETPATVFLYWHSFSFRNAGVYFPHPHSSLIPELESLSLTTVVISKTKDSKI